MNRHRRRVPGLLDAVAVVVEDLRLEQGRKVAAIAKRSGVGTSTLNRVRNAEAMPTLDALWFMAEALGMKLSQLIAEVEHEMEDRHG